MSGSGTEHGIVLRGTGGIWSVRAASGETRDASLRGRLKQADEVKLAVGDAVVIEPDERGSAWTITEILPRRSQLTRRAPGRKQAERVVAANIDQVVIIFAAARPEPHLRMLDRFLAIAEANELPARVVVNKMDLEDDARTRQRFANYSRAGYPLHFTSIPEWLGMNDLKQALAGRSSVLTGPSGVGKSSLLNALYPGLGLRVGEISESVGKGRHTTVGGSVHPLPDGGYAVDTPGLREVGLWGLPSESIDRCFPEFRPFLQRCRFTDCTHTVEPECAVREAVDRGDIAAERYDSYRKMRSELEESERSW